MEDVSIFSNVYCIPQINAKNDMTGLAILKDDKANVSKSSNRWKTLIGRLSY